VRGTVESFSQRRASSEGSERVDGVYEVDDRRRERPELATPLRCHHRRSLLERPPAVDPFVIALVSMTS
jgi:hypothetical protein